MKVLLIIGICLLAYLAIAFITGLIDVAFDGYVPPDDNYNWSSVDVGLAWPITLPLMIVVIIYRMIVVIIYRSLDKAIKKFSGGCDDRS